MIKMKKKMIIKKPYIKDQTSHISKDLITVDF